MKNFCKWTALSICGVLAVLTVLLVLPGLFRIYPLIVRSGSMEPAYPVGSLIYVKAVGTSGLEEGKAVTFYLPDEVTLVTHRIVAVEESEQAIYTKGDANEAEDSLATPFSRILGAPFLCVPGLGYAADFLESSPGKACIVVMVVAVCLLSWLEGIFQKKEESHV